jgi:hypothetical protein
MDYHYSSIFHHLSVQQPERLARLTRSAAPFASLDTMHEEMKAVNLALDPLRSSCAGLLIDVRLAPARNDADFERAFEPHRARLHAGFARSAVLTKTVVGRMHAQRLVGAASHLGAFAVEAEAVSFLLLKKMAERSV